MSSLLVVLYLVPFFVCTAFVGWSSLLKGKKESGRHLALFLAGLLPGANIILAFYYVLYFALFRSLIRLFTPPGK